MRKVWGVIRYSSIGVFFAGIISFIQGCSQNEINFAFLLWLILSLLGGGGGEEGVENSLPQHTAIVLFSAGTTVSGDFETIGAGADGREGADNICQGATIPAGVDPTTVRAFLSVSGSDDLIDLPSLAPGFSAALPVVGPPPILTPIAADWADLFDADDLLSSFFAAGVTSDAASDRIWTGSNGNGIVNSRNCSGWTTSNAGTGATEGMLGRDVLLTKFALTGFAGSCGGAAPAGIELICVGAQ